MISVSVKFYGYFSFFPIRQSKFNRIIPDTNRHDSIRARPDLHLTETFLFLYSNLYRRIKIVREINKAHRIPQPLRIIPVIPDSSMMIRTIRTKRIMYVHLFPLTVLLLHRHLIITIFFFLFFLFFQSNFRTITRPGCHSIGSITVGQLTCSF